MRTACRMIVLLAAFTAGAGPASWQRAAEFDEQWRWATLADGAVRLYVNAPAAAADPKKPTLLVLYATPNGSTIEQTLGCARAAGVDWHYDIQHVAAQIRRLREIDTRENVVLAVTQATSLSWPTFRKDNKTAGDVI